MHCYSEKQEIVDNLYTRFRCHGVTRNVISDVIDLGLHAGFTLEQSVVAARMSISKHYGFCELFSKQDVITATGMSEAEVDAAKSKCEAKLIKQGEDPREYFPQISFTPNID